MDADVLKSRLVVYNFIRDVLNNEPNEEMLSSLAQDGRLRELSAISEGANRIADFLTSLQFAELDQVVGELKLEYRRLFIGPNFLPAPLWESVALSREHLMFDEETFRVREAYAQFGLSFIRLNNEPEDHIATELEFVSHLIERMLALDSQRDKPELLNLLEAQIAFLKDHLLKWAPQSFEMLLVTTSCKLYQGLALLVMEFLPCDLEIAINLREDICNE